MATECSICHLEKNCTPLIINDADGDQNSWHPVCSECWDIIGEIARRMVESRLAEIDRRQGILFAGVSATLTSLNLYLAELDLEPNHPARVPIISALDQLHSDWRTEFDGPTTGGD